MVITQSIGVPSSFIKVRKSSKTSLASLASCVLKLKSLMNCCFVGVDFCAGGLSLPSITVTFFVTGFVYLASFIKSLPSVEKVYSILTPG